MKKKVIVGILTGMLVCTSSATSVFADVADYSEVEITEVSGTDDVSICRKNIKQKKNIKSDLH